MSIIHFDSDTKREVKNSRLLKQELSGLGLPSSDLLTVGRANDFLGSLGAESLVSRGGYRGLLINTLGADYTGVLETAVLQGMEEGLEQHPSIVLIGSGSVLERHVTEYGVQVIDAPDGYLQDHHLPQVRTVLHGMGQG